MRSSRSRTRGAVVVAPAVVVPAPMVCGVGYRWQLMGLKIQRVESKRVDAFENMSDEELRQYVYGTKELDS
jgi:hypothetical protein